MLDEQANHDDAVLRRDLELAREAIIAEGFFAYDAPNQAMEDLVVALKLPWSVLVAKLLDLDEDPGTVAARHAPRPPVETSPARAQAPDPDEEPFPGGALMLGYVMVMARRRQLKAYHSGAHIALSNSSGETRYSGTIEAVYNALKADSVATRRPPTPAQELRSRLANAVGWGAPWTLQDDNNGFYALCRGDPPERIFTGAFEDMRLLAECRILNTVQNRGYA
jgi:hypothetical protein